MDELVVGALQERRIDRDNRLQALHGEARREGNRVLFGDRDVEIAIGEALREFDESRALAHCRRDADDALVAGGHIAQPLSEDLREGRAAGLFLEDRAAGGVERTWAVPLDRVGLGRRVALAL